MSEKDYCGCCGREIDGRGGQSTIWCRDCEAHLAPGGHGIKFWDRTFQAQHGKPCPFQVGVAGSKSAAAAAPKSKGRGGRKRASASGLSPEPSP